MLKDFWPVVPSCHHSCLIARDHPLIHRFLLFSQPQYERIRKRYYRPGQASAPLTCCGWHSLFNIKAEDLCSAFVLNTPTVLLCVILSWAILQQLIAYRHFDEWEWKFRLFPHALVLDISRLHRNTVSELYPISCFSFSLHGSWVLKRAAELKRLFI